ncbi:polyprenyl synthetase family protein, partial [Desulfobulbus sp. F4]|nr:polyprenyl synthetase family protein [Desulfobulbus sp. F4]
MQPSVAENATLFGLIAKNTAEVDAAMRTDMDAALVGCDPLLAEVLTYSLLGGGKRLRPLLTTVCSRLCGGQDSRELGLLAAAFEYLHTATLIHDDVLDHAEQRRGRKSVVEQHGLTAAILAGDWLHARSM